MISRTGRTKSGFTLMEMLVVLAIISIMLGVGVPFFRTSSQRAKLKAAVRGIISLLNYARMTAVGERNQVKALLEEGCIRIYVRHNDSWQSAGKQYCIPPGVMVSLNNEIVFYPSGEAEESFCIEIKNDLGKQRQVCVSGLSGKVYTK